VRQDFAIIFFPVKRQPAKVIEERRKTALADALDLILVERTRQIMEERHTLGRDARHVRFELRRAAQCYAEPPAIRLLSSDGAPRRWPWSRVLWRPEPTSRIRELTKAGAFFLAEADRVWGIGHTTAAELMRRKAQACARFIVRHQRGAW